MDLIITGDPRHLLARSPDLSELRINSLRGGSQSSRSCNLFRLFSQVNKSNVVLPLQQLELRGLAVTPDNIRPHLRHFRRLEILKINRNTAPGAITAFGEICHVLDNYGVSLGTLSIDHLDDPVLLDLLSSHPEFREIRLESISHELLDRVLRQILPAQRKTLERFMVDYYTLDVLPPDSHLDDIGKCHQLRILCVRLVVSKEEFEQNIKAAAVRDFHSIIQSNGVIIRTNGCVPVCSFRG
jgi:hypothetical protein